MLLLYFLIFFYYYFRFFFMYISTNRFLLTFLFSHLNKHFLCFTILFYKKKLYYFFCHPYFAIICITLHLIEIAYIACSLIHVDNIYLHNKICTNQIKSRLFQSNVTLCTATLIGDVLYKTKHQVLPNQNVNS